MRNKSDVPYHNVPETVFLRDDEIARLVNELREVCLVHGKTGHLREVISRVVKKHVNRVRVGTIKSTNQQSANSN